LQWRYWALLKMVTAVSGNVTSERVRLRGRPVFVHSARTAATAVASLLVARLFRLPESYWAPVTTLVITQASLGAALSGSCSVSSGRCSERQRVRLWQVPSAHTRLYSALACSSWDCFAS